MALRSPRSSRQRYRDFRQDYRQRQLDEPDEAGGEAPSAGIRASCGAASGANICASTCAGCGRTGIAVGAVFVFALLTAGLQMIEPLFMRFIIDRVLLNTTLDSAARVSRASTWPAGCSWCVIIVSSLIGVLKDYRQRLLNVRVMLSLRRALFDRLLHLPLPQAVGHEDRRHPVAPDRRRRHDDRPAADGARVARGLDRSGC